MRQVAEVTELRGATSRQDAEVRQLRAQNQDLAQKAALVEALTAEVDALKSKVGLATLLRTAQGLAPQ
jgi:cell shape-determining protein MreC